MQISEKKLNPANAKKSVPKYTEQTFYSYLNSELSFCFV